MCSDFPAWMHVCSSSPCHLGSRTLGSRAAVFTTDTAIASQISKASNPQLHTSSQATTNSDIIFNMMKEVTLQKKKRSLYRWRRSLYRRRRGHSTEEEEVTLQKKKKKKQYSKVYIHILCWCFSGIWSWLHQGSIPTSWRASWQSLYPQTGADDVSRTPHDVLLVLSWNLLQS